MRACCAHEMKLELNMRLNAQCAPSQCSAFYIYYRQTDKIITEIKPSSERSLRAHPVWFMALVGLYSRPPLFVYDTQTIQL